MKRTVKDANSIIVKFITKSTTYSKLTFDVTSQKICLGVEPIDSSVYEAIQAEIQEEYPDTKILVSSIKRIVKDYANKNKTMPSYADWFRAHIELGENGKPLKTYQNLVNFFEHCPELAGRLRHNDITCFNYLDDAPIEDADVLKFRCLAENTLGYANKNDVYDAILQVCSDNSYNPFRDAIQSFVWDGKKRVSRFFIEFLGAEDTKLNESLTEKWMYALIKRIFEPGCAFDNMLIVFDDKQGTGKTKIVKRLVDCMGFDYGYETAISYDSTKDNIDKLNKACVIAIDELTGYLKTEPEKAKQFICASEDTARLAYERSTRIFKRHCVFYGSTNVELFLKDYTSDFERRYWIMDCNGEVHSAEWWSTNLPDEYLQQVLAEAYYLYQSQPNYPYESLTLEEVAELKAVQRRHKTYRNDDILKDQLDEILNNRVYLRTEFDKYDDMNKVFTSYTEPIIPNASIDNLLDLDNSSEESNRSGKITKIPATWLKQYIKENLKRDIGSTKYLTAIMEDLGFNYRVIFYNGKSVKGYYKD